MDELVAMTVAEYGAPAFFAGYVNGQARDFFLLVQDLLKPENFAETNGNATITKVPVGVAGLLTPWNGNPWFVCGKAASALAAGCTVVIKPASPSTCSPDPHALGYRRAAVNPAILKWLTTLP
jgi:aldehyde dehydrogenase (NAD+)